MQRKLFGLLILSMILSFQSCQSPTNKLVGIVDDLCIGSFQSTNGSLEAPPEIQIEESDIILRGKIGYVPADKFRSAIIHAQDLSRCGKARECLLKHIQYKYQCEREFVQNINSWIPFALQGRGECSYSPPSCVPKY